MSNTPDRTEITNALSATLRERGLVIKLQTGRMVVQEKQGHELYRWTWYTDGWPMESSNLDRVEEVAVAVLDQCGTRAVLATLENVNRTGKP